MQHKFETLDGLRWIAALAVMAFHRRDWFGGPGFFGHAYLAVDFFFMLSGFVIAHAYEARLVAPGGTGGFLRDRIIRLHPLLILGAVLAAAVAAAEAHAGKPSLHAWPALTFVASLLPVPAPWAGAPSMFPWNLAIWSLFWELVVNLLYALLARHLTTSRLLAAAGICVAIMAATSIMSAGFHVGFPNAPVPFALGLPRVLAPFCLGILLLRRHRARPLAPRPLGPLCVIVLVLSLTALPNDAAGSALYDPVMAYIIYPPLILVAAAAPARWPVVCAVGGALSYPLYVLHEPTLKIIGRLATLSGLSDGHPDPAEALLRLALVVPAGYLALRFYDEPARAWLRRRFGSKRHRMRDERSHGELPVS